MKSPPPEPLDENAWLKGIGIEPDSAPVCEKDLRDAQTLAALLRHLPPPPSNEEDEDHPEDALRLEAAWLADSLAKNDKAVPHVINENSESGAAKRPPLRIWTRWVPSLALAAGFFVLVCWPLLFKSKINWNVTVAASQWRDDAGGRAQREAAMQMWAETLKRETLARLKAEGLSSKDWQIDVKVSDDSEGTIIVKAAVRQKSGRGMFHISSGAMAAISDPTPKPIEFRGTPDSPEALNAARTLADQLIVELRSKQRKAQ